MCRGAGPIVKRLVLFSRLAQSRDDAPAHQFDGRGGMLMNPSPYEPPLHPSELNRTTRMRSFVRFLAFFIVGVTATLAWQSYGGPARVTIASWSPRLAWLTPPAPPTGADQIVALSRDLAVVRQSVDKLAANISKLQAPQRGTPQTPPAARGASPAR